MPKKPEAEEEKLREVFFFFVTAGKTFKQIYNLNCQCNVLLDAIRLDSRGYLTAAIQDRLDDIKFEKATAEEREQEIAQEAQAEAQAALAAAAQKGAEENTEEAAPVKSPVKKSKGTIVTKTGGNVTDSKEKEREEEIASLIEKKTALDAEDEQLRGELASLEEVKAVDLFDGDGLPLNLRENGEKYATEIVKAGGAYQLVSVTTSEEGQITQEPLELSI